MKKTRLISVLISLAALTGYLLPIQALSGPTIVPQLSLLLLGCQEVTSSTGRVWLDRNLGASRVATSSADSESFGDLYQWGRLSDGHEKRTSSTTPTLSPTDVPGHGDYISASGTISDWRSTPNNDLWQGSSGINNPCPAGFRLPTESEFNDEMATWISQDADGAFASPLKLVMAGQRLNENFYNSGSAGSYWSSTVLGEDSRRIRIISNGASPATSSRVNAFSVRCIKD